MTRKETFLLMVLFISYITTQAQWIQIGENIDGEDQYNDFGTSVDLNSDGSITAIGAIGNYGNVSDAGYVRIFENINGAWLQIGNDIGGEAAHDQSGRSVSLSADGYIIAIGADGNEGNGSYSGHVRVFENINNSWSQIGEDLDGESTYELFGRSVSLSADGSILAVGGPGIIDNDGDDVGRTRVFKNTNGSWLQIGDDIDGEEGGEKSGYSVSLSSDGSIVAIGAPSNGEFSDPFGSVRVFENINDSWSQVGENIQGEAAYDFFGNSVSLSSNGFVVAIGAKYNDGNGDGSGHVRVFEYINGIWSQIGDDIDGEAEYDFSGLSVSLNSNGSVVAIGARYNDGNETDSGHVRIYQNLNGIWTQVGTDIDGDALGDNSGYSVSLSSEGSIVGIGAPFNDDNGVFAGQVKVFGNELLGLSENSNLESYIFPNPTNGILTIKSTSNTPKQISIYDITGKQLFNQQHLENNNQSQIDISNLEKGIYILKIKADNKVFASKIIKE